MKTHTVIGIWEDDHSRFAAPYETHNTDEAEELAQEACGNNQYVENL